MHAQAIIGLPELAPGEARERLFQTLSGLRSVLDPLGVSLLGGHTTIGEDLTVGLSVSGDGPAAADLLRQAALISSIATLTTRQCKLLTTLPSRTRWFLFAISGIRGSILLFLSLFVLYSFFCIFAILGMFFLHQ